MKECRMKEFSYRDKTNTDPRDVLIRKRKEFLEKMCPVFKTNCKGGKCHSYFEGSYKEVTDAITIESYFMIHDPYCTCYIVTGLKKN